MRFRGIPGTQVRRGSILEYTMQSRILTMPVTEVLLDVSLDQSVGGSNARYFILIRTTVVDYELWGAGHIGNIRRVALSPSSGLSCYAPLCLTEISQAESGRSNLFSPMCSYFLGVRMLRQLLPQMKRDNPAFLQLCPWESFINPLINTTDSSTIST